MKTNMRQKFAGKAFLTGFFALVGIFFYVHTSFATIVNIRCCAPNLNQICYTCTEGLPYGNPDPGYPICPHLPDGSLYACWSNAPITCGPSNGGTFGPGGFSSGKCSDSSDPGLSARSQNGYWTGWNWTCGSNSCSATLQPGICGNANGATLSSAPSAPTDLCGAGSSNGVSGTGSSGDPWRWSCSGTSCSAQLSGGGGCVSNCAPTGNEPSCTITNADVGGGSHRLDYTLNWGDPLFHYFRVFISNVPPPFDMVGKTPDPQSDPQTGSVVVTPAATTNYEVTFDNGFSPWPTPCNTTVNVIAATAKLTASISGAGSGGVTSAPSGINFSFGSQNYDFSLGTSVTLTATPTNGSTFSGWGGDCSGTGTCTVVMNSAKSVSATFIFVAPCTCSSSENANHCVGSYTNSCGKSCGTKDCRKYWREVAP